MTVKLLTIKEIQLKAADILEARWCRDDHQQLSTGDYMYNLLDACREASGYYAAEIAFASARALAAEAADGAYSAGGRTREEAIAALRAAI